MAKNSWETQFFEGLESISRKADMLNSYYTNTGDPGFITKDIARYRSVTSESIRKTLSQYIVGQNRVVLHVHPQTTEESEK